jgi:hypothetical protein
LEGKSITETGGFSKDKTAVITTQALQTSLSSEASMPDPDITVHSSPQKSGIEPDPAYKPSRGTKRTAYAAAVSLGGVSRPVFHDFLLGSW